MSDYYILQDGNIHGLNFGHLVKKIEIHESTCKQRHKQISIFEIHYYIEKAIIARLITRILFGVFSITKN